MRNLRVSGAMLVRAAMILAIVAAVQTPALATFHFARIVEIYTGNDAQPGAQYIIIMPHSDVQDLFQGVSVEVYDAAGNPLPDFALFASNLPDTATDQKSILVATADAQTIFGVTPDQVATGALPSSGVVCFFKAPLTPDCVSYGNYTGASNVGGSPTGTPAPSIPSGAVLRRDLGADGTLQSFDDTDDSAADFDRAGPIPENYAGVRLENLTVSGNVTLDWASTGANNSIYKTDDPATVRDSAAVATTTATTWNDPNPNQFPGLTCYVVKPQ